MTADVKTRLYGATGDAIARLDETGDGWTVQLSLGGEGAQCLAVDPADPDRVYAGLREGGVRRTDDGGRTWVDRSAPQPAVFSLAVSPADGALYAGTEPSALYWSDDAGETWRELDALLELPSRPTWSFPPRPWTSHVRWIAPNPHDADLILVGIELGGLMRSTDAGATWQDHRPGAARDVHSLAWHPRAEGRAYEAGGDGAAWSEDAGETWRPADEGRDRHYTWAVAVDPQDPGVWYVSASTGPFAAHGFRGGAQARIFRRHDGTWRALAGGLPEPLQAMPYALVATERRLFAGLADGQLWESSDRGETWRACALRGDALTELHALACVGG
jgi:BNR/Asp-box repeat